MRSSLFGVLLTCVPFIVANPVLDDMKVVRALAADGDRVVLGAGEIHLVKRAEENPELCCECENADVDYLQSVKTKRDAAGEDYTVIEIKPGAFEEYFGI